MKNKTIAAHTLGCKVNQYDTQAMLELFQSSGYDIVEFHDIADVYLVNTCTVTAIADKKSRQFLSQAKKRNSDAVIIAAGCYSQRMKDEILKYCDIAIGTDHRNQIVDILNAYLLEHNKQTDFIDEKTEYEPLFVTKQHQHTRAFMKIQEGCNNYCAYCIIPSVRGDIRSRTLSDIALEASSLYKNNVKEIVLTGINLSSYGLDQKDRPTLFDVINTIKDCGITRVRLGSIDPGTFLKNPEIVANTKDILCPQFHLSLQSGCDKTLKSMNRWYTSAQYKEEVDLIKFHVKHSNVTTDIIVGFPGETEEDFKTTYNFVKEISFGKIHVFPYSTRPNTAAASMKDTLPNSIKKQRVHKLMELGAKLEKEYVNSFVGKTVDVLFERMLGDHYVGFSREYVNVNVQSSTPVDHEIHKVNILSGNDEQLYGILSEHK